MKKILATLMFVALAGGSILTAPAPASAHTRIGVDLALGAFGGGYGGYRGGYGRGYGGYYQPAYYAPPIIYAPPPVYEYAQPVRYVYSAPQPYPVGRGPGVTYYYVP